MTVDGEANGAVPIGVKPLPCENMAATAADAAAAAIDAVTPV
jgi:hypothetical protein